MTTIPKTITFPSDAPKNPSALFVCRQHLFECCKGVVGQALIRFITNFDPPPSDLIQMTGVFIVMTVNAQIFPVTAVGRIVVVIVVPMVNGEFVQIPTRELPTAAPAHPWV
jgi:hypothetical protein